MHDGQVLVTGCCHENIHEWCVVITFHSPSVYEQLDVWVHWGICSCIGAAHGELCTMISRKATSTSVYRSDHTMLRIT